MRKSKKFITLKEAAKISGYSSDYIGQLIRTGKISGKQIYCNITWVTTAGAVLDYKSKKEKSNNKFSVIKDFFGDNKRKLLMEFEVFKLFIKILRSTSSVLIVIIFSFLLFNFYLFHYFLNKNIEQSNINLPKQYSIDHELFY